MLDGAAGSRGMPPEVEPQGPSCVEGLAVGECVGDRHTTSTGTRECGDAPSSQIGATYLGGAPCAKHVLVLCNLLLQTMGSWVVSEAAKQCNSKQQTT